MKAQQLLNKYFERMPALEKGPVTGYYRPAWHLEAAALERRHLRWIIVFNDDSVYIQMNYHRSHLQQGIRFDTLEEAVVTAIAIMELNR